MAINTYMILLPKNVALLPYNLSINGISGFNSQRDKFGLVQLVNPSCERVSAGQYVGFDESEAMLVVIATEIFYIVDEDRIKFIQTPIITPP